MRPRWLWLAVPGLLVIAVIVAAVVVLRDPAEPVSVDKVVARYRQSRASAASAGAPLPPGVYVYRTSGSEEVDALNGSRHDYPARTTLTVSTAADGCLGMRWDVLAQRWDDMQLCPGRDGGWSLRRMTLFHSFFNQKETRRYSCDAAGFVPSVRDGVSGTYTCDSPGSSNSGRSHDDGTHRVIGVEPVRVAGVDRQAVHVRYRVAVSGATVGEATFDRWYSFDRFPLLLREVKRESTASKTLIGTVHYQERYRTTLAAWEPAR